MTRRTRTKEQRLAAVRPVSNPGQGRIGTIQKLDSGYWHYVRKDGTHGIAETARKAVEKLNEKDDLPLAA